MKQTILSIFAIGIAILSVAFTHPVSFEKPTSYTFYFTGDPTDPLEVADETLWSLTSPGGNCELPSNKACQIAVDDDETEMVNGERVIKSTLNITAVVGSGGASGGYVPHPSNPGILAVSNRP